MTQTHNPHGLQSFCGPVGLVEKRGDCFEPTLTNAALHSKVRFLELLQRAGKAQGYGRGSHFDF